MKHSEETINTIKSMAEKGYSSRVIAELVLGSEKKKSTVNSILARVVEKRVAEDKGLKILFIADCQIKPGVDRTFVKAIGQYIVDKKTMVVEGYGHHNCYPFDEGCKGYQGNNHFRGVVMLHDAKNGFADPSFISTKFLIERLKND